MYSNIYQWKRIRKRVVLVGESKRSVAKAEGISRQTLRKMLAYDSPPGYRGRTIASKSAASGKATSKQPGLNQTRSSAEKQRWMDWLYELERGVATERSLTPALEALTCFLSRAPNNPRKKVLAVLAGDQGFSARAIGDHLGITRKTARSYLSAFEAGARISCSGASARKKRPTIPSLRAPYSRSCTSRPPCPDLTGQLGA